MFTEQGLPSDSVAFHGGFGLVSLYGIRKPGYRAFQLLHSAGDWRLGTAAAQAKVALAGLSGVWLTLCSRAMPGPLPWVHPVPYVSGAVGLSLCAKLPA